MIIDCFEFRVKVGDFFFYIIFLKIYIQYVKAKEVDGRYKEVAEVYRSVKDWDNVIRINLDYFQNSEEVVKIVRDIYFIEGVKMVVK